MLFQIIMTSSSSLLVLTVELGGWGWGGGGGGGGQCVDPGTKAFKALQTALDNTGIQMHFSYFSIKTCIVSYTLYFHLYPAEGFMNSKKCLKKRHQIGK